MSDAMENLSTCGCCETGSETAEHENRPGQPALVYRIGTHSSFLQRMKMRLSTQGIPSEADKKTSIYPLTKLATRSTEDPAIALIDAWAMVSDVLTFYQERIANEGYLHTATERRSVLEMARAIGYELSPGVAASSYLAFTVDDKEGSPKTATIKVGTQVMSIPASQDELPQTFETIGNDCEARAEWNAMKPQQTEPVKLVLGSREVYLKGVATNLKPGDGLLIIGREREEAQGSERWDFRRVQSVTADTAGGYTRVTWAEGLGVIRGSMIVSPTRKGRKVYAFRQRAALFGNNAPDPSTFKDISRDASTKDWSDLTISAISSPATETIHLDRVYPQIVPGSWLLLSHPKYEEIYEVVEAVEDSRVGFTLAAKTTRVKLKGENLNEKFDNHVRDAVVFAQTEELEIVEKPLTTPVAGTKIKLDSLVDGLAKGQTLIVSGKRARITISPAVDDLTEGLTLKSADGKKLVTLKSGDSLQVMDLPVSVENNDVLTPEKLVKALADTKKPKDIRWRLIDRDGAVGYLTAGSNLLSLEAATKDDATISEIALIDGIQSDRDRTTLTLKTPLQNCYDRSTVAINANIVAATHGETVSGEVLGSSDGSKTNQEFSLKKSPLTYVSAATASGAKGTLEVRVNGVLWEEATSLYGKEATDHIYVVRIDNDAKATVIFGDGVSGARLPTGQENIKATYRAGIGNVGEVGAGSLTLLKSRPFGVRGVSNPLAASGAADPEVLENARANAPLTVLTLDRIVSLQDFEDFARAFKGLGKAQAIHLWDGETYLVHITIADDGGQTVDKSSETYTHLVAAIDAARDPTAEVQVDKFEPQTFNVKATVLYDAHYLPDDVQANIKDALKQAFSWDRRAFAQPVTAAEVVSVIHTVNGVVAVDLDAPASVLTAQIARRQGGDILRAQLLTINTSGINLTMNTAP